MSESLRSHKIRLVPTAAQERKLHGFARVARWTWNTVLRVHDAQIESWTRGGRIGSAPTIASLKPVFNQGRPMFAAWTTEVGHRDCWSQPFVDLQRAFAAKRAGTAKHPRRKRWNDAPSFYVANDKVTFDGLRIRLPKVGWVRTTEALRLPGKVMGVRVTRDAAGRWFASVQVQGVPVAPSTGTEALGIDVGIASTLTLSTGETFQAPRPSRRERKQLRRAQRHLARQRKARKKRRAAAKTAGEDARQVRASKREERTRVRVAQLHARRADRRRDWQHKTTTKIVRRSAAIGIETLSVAGMMQSGLRGMARALSEVGLGEILRQLGYKAEGAGIEVQQWPRRYPSSQLCSTCGHRQKLPLSIRTYVCPQCGQALDRDVNAALNLVPSAWRDPMRGTPPRGGMREFR